MLLWLRPTEAPEFFRGIVPCRDGAEFFRGMLPVNEGLRGIVPNPFPEAGGFGFRGITIEGGCDEDPLFFRGIEASNADFFFGMLHDPLSLLP